MPFNNIREGGSARISIQPPPTPGFSSPRNPNLVCKLKKAIYVTASDKQKQEVSVMSKTEVRSASLPGEILKGFLRA